ncbi:MULTISPECIES: response regulator transcription factor [Aliivibrio]|uniref:Response regulator transcription factor n=1 Tax=Aliivibrio finisterrensis TaxID=511998 RepID=A0A4Q5KXP8_9GAMM|nr:MULTISPECIES: response regulator transcription factor [Aliivibrio]MDD9180578.1 response regulator transcription factor [Aliivibrio sp. A6]RYU51359.1 response regulator transcription factor [Aliivibrio finisterrensis]RYU52539.1 response regulator transcription factor [Aliivibrio finisterrensis]RYU58069.1 response regulator transcription factor [Aliivibrio finisterrensis]RYU64557.1 response regulator transcription factor [Aliivibrio finisterrensis]
MTKTTNNRLFMFTTKKINALILDTFPIVVESITNELKKKDSIGEIYYTSSMHKAVDTIKNNDISFVILDIKQDKFNGLDLIKRIRKNDYNGIILVMSSYGYELYSDSARKLGANGYISKKESIELINDAITNVLRGYTIFKQSQPSKSEIDLSTREITVLNYLLRGYTNKQISEFLSLSSKTISTYKSRILDKYNVTSLIELVKINDALI